MLESKGLDLMVLEVVEDGKIFFWVGKYYNDMNLCDIFVIELNVFVDFKFVVFLNYKDVEVVMFGNLYLLV